MYFIPTEKWEHVYPLTPEELEGSCHLLHSWLNSFHNLRIMINIGDIPGYPNRWYRSHRPSVGTDFFFCQCLHHLPCRNLMYPNQDCMNRGSLSKALGTPVCLCVLSRSVVPLGHLAIMVSECSLWDRNDTAQQSSPQESESNTQNQARSSILEMG